ncbi:MAG: hypothetical protein IPM82_24530 [Saprospiraceae bacterium]|nr:hypothetical protein [Saprospiraceae bacterium]
MEHGHIIQRRKPLNNCVVDEHGTYVLRPGHQPPQRLRRRRRRDRHRQCHNLPWMPR